MGVVGGAVVWLFVCLIASCGTGLAHPLVHVHTPVDGV